MMLAHDLESRCRGVLKHYFREVGVQMIAAACNTPEHGIFWRDELDDDKIPRQFRRQINDFRQRDTVGHHHVVNDGEH